MGFRFAETEIDKFVEDCRNKLSGLERSKFMNSYAIGVQKAASILLRIGNKGLNAYFGVNLVLNI